MLFWFAHLVHLDEATICRHQMHVSLFCVTFTATSDAQSIKSITVVISTAYWIGAQSVRLNQFSSLISVCRMAQKF